MTTVARIVALDHGSRRIGVAVSDPLGLTAQPIGVIAADEDFVEAFRNLVAEWDVERVVVGLPVGLDGKEGPSAVAAREFAAMIEREFHMPTEVWDERFSTVVAERAMIEGGARRQRRREMRDAVAAAVFLQGYLDAAR